MIHFSRLRLNGFKSFVDKTELEIGVGLNGVVGPNGCGKSNLVEALRWVMGENSAKRMRGDDMDDVIFAGTDKRSARNFAEVSIVLDNASRKAPAAYNNSDEIEIVRRIERDHGSLYRINGKTVRARDVQMLFADTITGANSPSLVSQGHVTRMINAKPQDRRLILEESAGIAGLYARRHEAETRLRAADTNLTRVQDILGSMESRLNGLKRQSRQASKYKNLSAQIRQFEIIVTYLEWLALREKETRARERFAAAESKVAEKLLAVTQLNKTQSTQFEDLPPLRRQEAEHAAALQVFTLRLQKLEEECAQYDHAVKDVKDQIRQAQSDRDHETQTLNDTTNLLERIQAEQATLSADDGNQDSLRAQHIAAKETLEAQVVALEERFTTLKEGAAETRTRQDVLEKQITANEGRLSVLTKRIETAQNEKSALTLTEETKTQVKLLEENIEAAEAALSAGQTQTEALRGDIRAAEEDVEKLRRNLSEAQKVHASFSGEFDSLERFFKSFEEQNFAPVLDTIITEKGLETALSRALGDSLLAAIDPNAPSYWQAQPSAPFKPALPEGAMPLLPRIQAPEELHAALSQIGLVPDEATGNALCAHLKQGQSLVTPQGTTWRWDGYVIRESATDRHALYLEQRNKLYALAEKRESIEKNLSVAQAAVEESNHFLREKRQAYEAQIAEIKTYERKLAELRPALAKIREKSARAQSEQIRLEEIIQTAMQDSQSVAESIRTDKLQLAAIKENQNAEVQESIEKVRADLSEIKGAYHEAVRALDAFQQQESTRRARLQAIADERISLQNRAIRAREHLKGLMARLETLEERHAALHKEPKNFEHEKIQLQSQKADLEIRRQNAADKLQACEEELSITGRALKEAEQMLGDVREERAHAQATVGALSEQLGAMERHIEETMHVPVKDLVHHAAVDLVSYTIGDLEKLKAEKDTLSREREAIGPVNLRADEESDQLERELTTMLHERNDLLQAIEELRGAIATINKEARERLTLAFDRVNAHFQRLFVQLFGGGKAHLQLLEADDPLGAGLEIFAQPPGKALQSLSLLSGGEQTLTSIALIFAMFLTNPSPICVLDEIDAPLDDSNVDRVCDLLDEIAERGETRFLIITHHRLTMARMHRLYGVTMGEKGVSQLVSVDLQHSFAFLDKAA